MQVRNLTYLRRKNKESIIKLLCEKELSYSELARALQLSNTAISKIVDDLIQDNIVLRVDETKGRSGINLRINSDLGYVIAIDLSEKIITLTASNCAGIVLKQNVVGEIITFTKTHMERIIAECKKLTVCDELNGKELLCIYIASPGKIDSTTNKYILNPRFIDCKDYSLIHMFKEKFNCDIVIKNDVKLALLGEKYYGDLLSDDSNALMLHIDVGTGAALMTNGKVYEGTHGFSGEIGFFKLNMFCANNSDYMNVNYTNYFDCVSLFTLQELTKNEILRGATIDLGNGNVFSNEDVSSFSMKMMIEAYRANDGSVTQIIDSAAKLVGNVAKNLADFLDVDTIILNGTVKQLGDRYLNIIKSFFADNVTVSYNTVNSNATVYGAIHEAIQTAFQTVLNKSSKK